jgi:hypothetical protein
MAAGLLDAPSCSGDHPVRCEQRGITAFTGSPVAGQASWPMPAQLRFPLRES